jgi:hypothetical protein
MGEFLSIKKKYQHMGGRIAFDFLDRFDFSLKAKPGSGGS